MGGGDKADWIEGRQPTLWKYVFNAGALLN